MKSLVSIAALSLLAVGGMAAASAVTFPQDFHGLRVLGASDNDTSGAEPATTKLGPYGSDAALLVTWEGEVSFAKPHRLTHADIELKRDGVALRAQRPAATAVGVGLALRVAGSEKLFLAHGQQTTLSMEAAGDPGAAPTARTRLAVTAIAAPS